MSRYVYIVAVLFGIGGFVAWQAKDADSLRDAVIEVADAYVTADEFRTAYADYLADTGLPDERKRRSGFAARLVGIELVAREAADNGAGSDPNVIQQIESIRQKLLVDFFLSKTVYADLTPEENELREMFLRINTSVKARHLFAPDLEAANRLKERLEAGETFASLAREAFDDPELAENGGSIGFFGFDEMDPAFEDAAFSMSVGQVSDPVRTAFGYSIIEVEDIQVKPILTESEYATKRDRMYQYVTYRKRNEARREVSESIVADLNPIFNTEGVDAVFAIIEGQTRVDPSELATELDGMTLVEFQSPPEKSRELPAAWAIGEFRAYAASTSAQQREAVKSKAALREFVKGLAVRQVLLARADAANFEGDEEYLRALDRSTSDVYYEHGYKQLTNEIVIPEDSVRAHFDKNRSSFVSKPTILVYEILTPTSDDANRAQKLLKTSSFESVASQMSIRPGAATTGGRLGPLMKSQLGVLGDQLFSAPLNEPIGPVEIDGHFGIFEVRENVAAHQASFEEVEGEIRAFLKTQFARTFLRAHVDSLRTVYPVTVDEERIQQIRLTKD